MAGGLLGALGPMEEQPLPGPAGIMSGGLLGASQPSSAGWMADPQTMGLLGIAAGLLDAGGPQQQRVSLGQALGRGLQGGVQFAGQAQQMGQADDLARTRKLMAKIQAAQLAMAGQKMEQEQQRQQQIAGIIGQLPEGQRQMATLDPETFAKRQIEQAFPEPMGIDKKFRTVGNSLVDLETGKPVYQAPFAPQAPDRSLVEVYDPNSPTGTKFVPRNQAVGMPGTPPSGTSISYDENGRPVITMGRQKPGEKPGDLTSGAKTEAQKQEMKGALEFKTADDALKALDERLKITGLALMPGKEKDVTSTTYRLAINELRKLTESGALQKADLEYLQTIINDPTALSSWASGLSNIMRGGSTSDSPRAQIEQARAYLDAVSKRKTEVYGDKTKDNTTTAPKADGPPRPATVQDALALPPGTRFIGPDGLERVR